MGSTSVQTKDAIRETFLSLEAKYIVTMTGLENNMDDFIYSNYHMVKKNEQFVLWERKE